MQQSHWFNDSKLQRRPRQFQSPRDFIRDQSECYHYLSRCQNQSLCLASTERFLSKSSSCHDRVATDPQDERRGWVEVGYAADGVEGVGRRENEAGIGNVPKLLYRRSIYGDEKHSLPSTPVAPAKGSRQPRSASCALPPLRRSPDKRERERESVALSISVCNQPFHQFGDIARRITFERGTTDYDGGDGATCNRLHVSGLLHEYMSCRVCVVAVEGNRQRNAEICGERIGSKFSASLTHLRRNRNSNCIYYITHTQLQRDTIYSLILSLSVSFSLISFIILIIFLASINNTIINRIKKLNFFCKDVYFLWYYFKERCIFLRETKIYILSIKLIFLNNTL